MSQPHRSEGYRSPEADLPRARAPFATEDPLVSLLHLRPRRGGGARREKGAVVPIETRHPSPIDGVRLSRSSRIRRRVRSRSWVSSGASGHDDSYAGPAADRHKPTTPASTSTATPTAATSAAGVRSAASTSAPSTTPTSRAASDEAASREHRSSKEASPCTTAAEEAQEGRRVADAQESPPEPRAAARETAARGHASASRSLRLQTDPSPARARNGPRSLIAPRCGRADAVAGAAGTNRDAGLRPPPGSDLRRLRARVQHRPGDDAGRLLTRAPDSARARVAP
jgi:hypothetical protein